MTAKLGAVEQRWAAQLASFDLEIRYRSGKSNKNADGLSCQSFSSDQLAAVIPGTPILPLLRGVVHQSRIGATQAAISALPGYSPLDIQALQESDPVTQDIMVFWRQKRRPSYEE